MYLEAGADAIFPEAMEFREEFERFAKAIPGAVLLANMTEFGKSPLLDVRTLGEMGYRLVLFPLTAFRAAMRAAEDTCATCWQMARKRTAYRRCKRARSCTTYRLHWL